MSRRPAQQRPASPFAEQPSSRWGTLAASVAIGGTVAYLGLYFVAADVHWQPFLGLLLPDRWIDNWIGGGWQRVGLLDRTPIVAVSLLLIAVAGGVGRAAMRLVGAWSVWTRAEAWLLAAAVGMNLLSTYTLAIGLCGGLRSVWLLWGPPLALACWSAWDARRRPLSAARLPSPAAEQRSFGRVLVGVSVVAALFLLAGSMLPPADFDVREYHAQVPKEWFQRGAVTFLPHNVYGNMPLGAEMHGALASSLMWGERPWWWGAMVGKTVIGLYTIVAAGLLWTAGRRLFSGLAGEIAAVLLLTTGWIVQVSMAGLIDVAVGLYLLAAVYVLLVRGRLKDAAPGTLQRGLPLLAGYLAGAAIACKYPAVLFVPLLLAGLCLFRPRPLAVVFFLIAVPLGGGLWLGKNLVLVGNPVYPLLDAQFDGEYRTPDQNERWQRAHQVPRDVDGRRYALGQAWQSVAQVGWRSSWLSPLLVPWAIVAVVWSLLPTTLGRGPPDGASGMVTANRNQRREIWYLAFVLGGVFVLWWLLTHRIERFLVPALPVIALLAAAGATTIPTRWGRFAMLGLLGLAAAQGLLLNSSALLPGDHRYFVQLEQLRLDVPSPLQPGVTRVNPAHRWLNANVAADRQVLLVGDAQPFDLEVAVRYNTCFDSSQLEELIGGRTTARERWQALHDAGISHLYVSWSDLDRYRQPGNYGCSPFPTRSLIRDEMMRRDGILRRLPLDVDRELGELFEVVEPRE